MVRRGIYLFANKVWFKISVVFQPQIYIGFNHQILNMSHAKTCVGGFQRNRIKPDIWHSMMHPSYTLYLRESIVVINGYS